MPEQKDKFNHVPFNERKQQNGKEKESCEEEKGRKEEKSRKEKKSPKTVDKSRCQPAQKTFPDQPYF